MIDSYNWIAITLRVMSLLGVLFLMGWQIKLLKPPVRNQWIRYVMIGLMSVMAVNYAQSLVLNFYRQADGNLSLNARHFSLLFTALSGVVSVILVGILYLRNLDKRDHHDR